MTTPRVTQTASSARTGTTDRSPETARGGALPGSGPDEAAFGLSCLKPAAGELRHLLGQAHDVRVEAAAARHALAPCLVECCHFPQRHLQELPSGVVARAEAADVDRPLPS